MTARNNHETVKEKSDRYRKEINIDSAIGNGTSYGRYSTIDAYSNVSYNTCSTNEVFANRTSDPLIFNAGLPFWFTAAKPDRALIFSVRLHDFYNNYSRNSKEAIMDFNPQLLIRRDGTKITCSADWQARRGELVDILAREEYGYLPPKFGTTEGRIISTETKVAGGHAVVHRVEIDVPTEKGIFTFPINLIIPKANHKVPVFVLINFRPDLYDMYYPLEEIVDNGFALAVIYYNDVTADNCDMNNGLAGMFTRSQDGTGYGKISLWAYAASRALDYLETRNDIDTDCAAVIGHSRLGKTALWCGANDSRFKYVISNDSGCSGAAYERDKHEGAETIRIITGACPFWFCENFLKYVGHESERNFDQHFLIAASAPRYVLINSASRDLWADPMSEQESCIAASPAWEINGMQGFIGPREQAGVGEPHIDGSVGYFRRDGIHFLSRADWQNAMAFIRKHR